ncbi:MAG: hypothetical protein AAB038_03345 [Planctomycetota bacterium]
MELSAVVSFKRIGQYVMSVVLMLGIMEMSVFAYGYEDEYSYKKDASTGNLNIFWGTKTLEKDSWDPVETQGDVGLALDFRKKDWSVNMAIEFFSSTGENSAWDPSLGLVDYTGATTEFNVGIKKIWEDSGNMRPFIGVGISSVTATFAGAGSFGTISDSSGAVGTWLSGGVFWTFNKSFNMGFEFKASTATVTLYGIGGDAGGEHIGLFFGFHW